MFANFSGGTLNIDVDVDRPNIKIGVVSYDAVQVNLTGAYADRVTALEFTGYLASGGSCGAQSPAITGASGIAPERVILSTLAPVTVPNPNGYSSMVCAYSCANNSNQGGCNTEDQVRDYFRVHLGQVCVETIQYDCWAGGTRALSAMGNCTIP